MIEIQLTQGQVTFVDDIDADLAEFKWCAQFIDSYAGGGKFIATRARRVSEGGPGILLLHRVIMSRILERELLRSEFVDHIHGLTLDNRRSEIRLATNSQNMMNKSKHKNSTSLYKCVTWHAGTGKWRAYITINKKRRYLGLFVEPREAYEAYCVAARELFGEFARLE